MSRKRRRERLRELVRPRVAADVLRELAPEQVFCAEADFSSLAAHLEVLADVLHATISTRRRVLRVPGGPLQITSTSSGSHSRRSTTPRVPGASAW